MATLRQIRQAIADTINANTDVNIHAYSMVEDIANVPSIMVEPVAADFEGAFARGMHTWDFNIFVMVTPSATSAHGQRLLDKLVDGAGPDSISKIVDANQHLGLSEETFGEVYMMKGYGGNFDWNKVPHIGAVVKIRVHTNPNE